MVLILKLGFLYWSDLFWLVFFFPLFIFCSTTWRNPCVHLFAVTHTCLHHCNQRSPGSVPISVFLGADKCSPGYLPVASSPVLSDRRCPCTVSSSAGRWLGWFLRSGVITAPLFTKCVPAWLLLRTWSTGAFSQTGMRTEQAGAMLDSVCVVCSVRVCCGKYLPSS